jgi:signal transduction histidine kinase
LYRRVDQILRGGKHLLGLINEVLDISRIETGDLALSTGTGQLPPAGPVLGPSEDQACNASQAAGTAASVVGVVGGGAASAWDARRWMRSSEQLAGSRHLENRGQGLIDAWV